MYSYYYFVRVIILLQLLLAAPRGEDELVGDCACGEFVVLAVQQEWCKHGEALFLAADVHRVPKYYMLLNHFSHFILFSRFSISIFFISLTLRLL